MSSIVRHRTDSAEYQVHVRRGRGGAPAIFLHGAGFGGHAERQAFARLLEDADLLWFDLLGGPESPPTSPGAVTWQHQIDDVIAIVEHLADGPVDVIGHCLGAHITHDLVRQRRSLIRRVVWYSPVHSIPDTFKGIIGRALVERRLDPATLSESQRGDVVRLLRTPAASFDRDDAARVLGLSAAIHDFQGLYWTDPAALARTAEVLADHPFSAEAFLGLQGSYFAEGRQSLPLPDYTGIPVLMLHSSSDGITPWESNGQLLQRAIPHAEDVHVEGGSHWLHLQQPARAAALTSRFLR